MGRRRSVVPVRRNHRYGKTRPRQVTTRNGVLVITMDSVDTLQPAHSSSTITVACPGSTTPPTAAVDHLVLDYGSGMIQSWIKFSFTCGYIDVKAVHPRPDANTRGYVRSLKSIPLPLPSHVSLVARFKHDWRDGGCVTVGHPPSNFLHRER